MPGRDNVVISPVNGEGMKRPAARLASAVALATAACLGSGSPAMAKVPTPTPSHGSHLSHARTATCVKDADGRLTHCPKPLAAKALPKAARDTSFFLFVCVFVS